MLLNYVGPHDAVEVPMPDGSVQLAEREGKPIDVEAEHAKRLLEQPSNWKRANDARGKKPDDPADKKASAADESDPSK